MKNNYKRYTIIIVGILISGVIMMTSCKKGLDFTNTNAINPTGVWGNPTSIRSFLTDIYGSSMPGWSFDNNSDEGTSGAKTLSNYYRGIVTIPTVAMNLNYTVIEKCNFFLDQLATTPASVLSGQVNNQYTGEAKFWRAWTYWNMVSQVGGVPLILHKQNSADVTSLRIPRSKTSVCVAQIVKDLDSAAMVLPATYTGADFGRITKIAAMGLKGRILLWYASPLFNPTNDQTRWQAAYTATKAAVDAATAAGYGLDPSYRDIFYNQNKEMIMVNQYYFPDHYANFAPIRPIPFTNGSTGNNQPLWSLLTAYPKRDGSPMQADPAQLSNPVYNAQFLNDFYTNRDDRFYATIFCGGTPYPTPDIVPGQTAKFTFWDAFSTYTATSQVNISKSVIPGGGSNSISGFWDRKGLDTLITYPQVPSGAAGAHSYWVPMRFAELLMNYGECANETSRTSEALSVLYQIRGRANILPGAGNNYGITAASTSDIRTAYINERQVEFAFENKRFDDLRRWKRFDILNSQGTRHGLILLLNAGQTLPLPTDNIMTSSVRSKFSAMYWDNLDFDATFKFNLDLNHWFYPLNPTQIVLEPSNLPQNIEWGGTFDPLQ